MGYRNGYIVFYKAGHPLAGKDGMVYEHRVVASDKLGRWLNPSEFVHHLDGNRANNSPDNLILVDNSTHMGFHRIKISHPCKTCGMETLNDVYCSRVCTRMGRRVVERPNREELLDELSKSSFEAIGRKYGVSGKAIRKWL